MTAKRRRRPPPRLDPQTHGRRARDADACWWLVVKTAHDLERRPASVAALSGPLAEGARSSRAAASTPQPRLARELQGLLQRRRERPSGSLLNDCAPAFSRTPRRLGLLALLVFIIASSKGAALPSARQIGEEAAVARHAARSTRAPSACDATLFECASYRQPATRCGGAAWTKSGAGPACAAAAARARLRLVFFEASRRLRRRRLRPRRPARLAQIPPRKVRGDDGGGPVGLVPAGDQRQRRRRAAARGYGGARPQNNNARGPRISTRLRTRPASCEHPDARRCASNGRRPSRRARLAAVDEAQSGARSSIGGVALPLGRRR